MWNYEEERQRQLKWQEEQERLLQVNAFSTEVRRLHHPSIFILVLKRWVCLFLGEIPTGSEEAGGRMAKSTARCNGGGTPRRQGREVPGSDYGSVVS